jgi:hypothetical protein
MFVVRFVHLVPALILIFSYTQAYTISHETCAHYGKQDLDLTTWLQEAMEEAKAMATLGREHVQNPKWDEKSNFHQNMFPDLSESDLDEVKGMQTLIIHGTQETALFILSIVGTALTLTCVNVGFYGDVVDMAYWDYEPDGDLVSSGPRIYCGSSTFVQDHGNWLETTSQIMVVLPDTPGADLCEGTDGITVPGTQQMDSLKGSELKHNAAMLIMCDGALKRRRPADVVRSDNNALEAATFTMVKRKGMLKTKQMMRSWKQADSPTQTGLGHVWSVTLLHELFHVVMDDKSKDFPFCPLTEVDGLTATPVYPMYLRLSEVFGWAECSKIMEMPPTINGLRHYSKHNPDSLSLYAAGM